MKYLVLGLVLSAGFNTYAKCGGESPITILKNRIQKSGSGTICVVGDPTDMDQVDVAIENTSEGLGKKINAQVIGNVNDKICLVVSEK